MVLTTIIGEVVGTAIGRVIQGVAERPDVPLNPVDAPMVASEVAGQVAEAVLADPRLKDLSAQVAHATSTEAWYQSRANWASIVSGLTPIAALAGYSLAPEDELVVAGVLAFIGNLVAAYLARRARTATRPIGA